MSEFCLDPESIGPRNAKQKKRRKKKKMIFFSFGARFQVRVKTNGLRPFCAQTTYLECDIERREEIAPRARAQVDEVVGLVDELLERRRQEQERDDAHEHAVDRGGVGGVADGERADDEKCQNNHHWFVIFVVFLLLFPRLMHHTNHIRCQDSTPALAPPFLTRWWCCRAATRTQRLVVGSSVFRSRRELQADLLCWR